MVHAKIREVMGACSWEGMVPCCGDGRKYAAASTHLGARNVLLVLQPGLLQNFSLSGTPRTLSMPF